MSRPRLDNYVEGYFSYLGKLGEKAVKEKSTELVWSITYSITTQICEVLESVKEERYQNYIIGRVLFDLDKVVISACAEKLPNSVYFGPLSFDKYRNVSDQAAKWLVKYFSGFIENMARANILGAQTIIDVAVMVMYLKLIFPELAIQMINTFGNVGEILAKQNGDLPNENHDYILNEINGRIDQIRPLTSDKKLNAQITKAVNAAKRKLKISNK